MPNQSLNFIHEITKAMNESSDPNQILDQILSACMDLSGAESGSIMLMDQSGRFLRLSTAIGLVAVQSDFQLGLGEGVTGWVAKHGRPRLVNDAQTEEDYIPLKKGLRSELAVPLTRQGRVLGVLSVDSSKPGAFHKQHERLLAILASLAAQIFGNLRDNKLLKLRDHLHRVMIDISRVVTSSADLSEVFREIMSITESSLGMQKSWLLLYDREKDCLYPSVSMEALPLDRDDVVYQPGEGVVGQVFLNKRSVYVPDTSREPGFLNRLELIGPESREGMFACPIFSGSEVVGVFSTFTSGELQLSSEHMLEFLEIVASFISQAITIQNLVQEKTRSIVSENIKLRQALGDKYRFGNLIGRSEPMLRLFDTVRIVADSRATVLINGESGTGKELIASAIHYNSPRKDASFIKINCAAIPESLLESELFGHKKGAFTGATRDKDGKFVLAHGGTIFLDEIGDMSLNLQSKLLRVLQEREVEPVGGRVRKVDIRVIAATNANLEELVKEKKFREDLFYRLNVIRLVIPPLCERKKDILPLVHHFIKKYTKENNKDIQGISQDAVRLLEGYHWPGNVRQLENVIERAVVLCQREVLELRDFSELQGEASLPVALSEVTEEASPPEVAQPPVIEVEHTKADADIAEPLSAPVLLEQFIEDMLSDSKEGGVYRLVVSEVERRLIVMALRKFRYTKVKAARYLGINRNTLDKKIKELQIEY